MTNSIGIKNVEAMIRAAFYEGMAIGCAAKNTTFDKDKPTPMDCWLNSNALASYTFYSGRNEPCGGEWK